MAMDADTLLSLLKSSNTPISTHKLAQEKNVAHQDIVGAMKSLVSKGGEDFLKLEETKFTNYSALF